MVLTTDSPKQDVTYFGEWNGFPPLYNFFWHHPRANKRLAEHFHTNREVVFIVVDKKVYLCFGTQWLQELRAHVLTTDGRQLKQNLQNFYPEFERIKKYLMSRVGENWKEKSDEQLAQDFHDVFSHVNEITGFDQYCMISEQFYLAEFEKYLRNEIGNNEKKFNEYRTTLTTPTRLSATQADELSLIQIAQKLQKADGDYSQIKTEIENHLREFGWLPVFVAGNAWDENYVRTELEKLVKRTDLAVREHEILDYGNAHTKATEQILSEFKHRTMWPELMQELAFIRNEGETLISLGTHVLRPAYEEFAKRMNISQEDFFYLTPDEIESFFKTKQPDANEIHQRKMATVVFTDVSKTLVVSGEKALNFFNKIYQRPEKNQSESLQGTCASVGQAQGTVHILHSAADMVNFKQGEILVADSTCIDYVPAMRKAAAVVTELGGITSHAAIVSRELGIPCIVGVPNVHLILKNGQRIAIDANNGKITLLEN